jgi:hypothetical protein
MLGGDSEVTQVIQMAIECLCDDWKKEPIDPILSLTELLDGMLVDACVARTYCETVRDENRRVKKAGLLDPVAPSHFSGSIEAKYTSMTSFVEPVLARENSSQSSVDLSVLFADAYSVNEDARNICDPILWPRLPGSEMNARKDVSDPATAA